MRKLEDTLASTGPNHSISTGTDKGAHYCIPAWHTIAIGSLQCKSWGNIKSMISQHHRQLHQWNRKSSHWPFVWCTCCPCLVVSLLFVICVFVAVFVATAMDGCYYIVIGPTSNDTTAQYLLNVHQILGWHKWPSGGSPCFHFHPKAKHMLQKKRHMSLWFWGILGRYSIHLPLHIVERYNMLGSLALLISLVKTKVDSTNSWRTFYMDIAPGTFTCPLKRDHFKEIFIFQPLTFRGHVSFRKGTVLKKTL